MNQRPWPWRLIMLWVGFLALDTFTQVAFKLGGNALSQTPDGWQWFVVALTTPVVWAAIFGYIGVFSFWILILHKMELSRAFPLTSLTYISVPLLAWAVLGEKIDLSRGFGIAVILVGVSLLGWETT